MKATKPRRPVEARRSDDRPPRYPVGKVPEVHPPSAEHHKRSPEHKRGGEEPPPRMRNRSPVRARSPIRQQRSPIRQQRSPIRQQRSPIRQQRSPIRQQRSPVRQQRSPVRQQRSPIRQQRSPIRQQRSPMRERERLIRRSASPRRLPPKREMRSRSKSPYRGRNVYPDSPPGRRRFEDEPAFPESYKFERSRFASPPRQMGDFNNPNPGINDDNFNPWGNPGDSTLGGYPEDQEYSREWMGGEKEGNYNDAESVLKFLSAEESHPCIPMFDAQNPDLTARQFLKVIDEIGAKEFWSSEKKKFQMASKLSGAPKEWFLREDKLTETWNRIKHAFAKAFPSDMDFCWNVQRMLNRVKLEIESYSNYFTYKTMLLKSCNITGRKAVSCIIGGLKNEDLKMQCFDQNFATPELLYTFLVQHEQMQKIHEDPSTSVQQNKKYCVLCKEYGHINRNCPQSQNYNQKPQPQCFDVIINGYTLQGYNDLHSQFMTIREDQALTIKLHYVKHKKETIQGYRGEYVDALGFVNVLLRIGSVVVNTPIYIVPDSFQDYPVVIGENLRKHPDVAYYEDQAGMHFANKQYTMAQSNSFAMNEKLVQKMNSSAEKVKQPRGGGDYPPSGRIGQRFEQPPNQSINGYRERKPRTKGLACTTLARKKIHPKPVYGERKDNIPSRYQTE